MKYFFFFISITFFAACYKDKGNYSYHTINDVAISMADSFVVITGDTLNVVPQLQQDIATDERRLCFEWSVRVEGGVANNSPDSADLVLSTTKELHAPIKLFAQQLKYALNYKVTDTVTGITYRKPASLRVTNDLSGGWMMLEQDGSKSDISFVNTFQQKAFHHVFSKANPGITLPLNAHHVYNFYFPAVTVVDYQYPRSLLTMLLLQDRGYVLENGSYKIVSDYTTLFTTPPAVKRPQWMSVTGPSKTDLSIINDGKLYRRFYGRGQLYFGDAYPTTDKSNYMLASIATYAYAEKSIYYDVPNHRFLSEFDGNIYELIQNGYNPWDAFDPNNVKGDLLGMGIGFYNVYAVFKNEDGASATIYQFVQGGVSGKTEVEASSDISKSPGFAFTKGRQQMYYGADNNVYLYDLAAKNYSTIYSFSSNEKVTAIGIEGDDLLIVATYNGSEGKVYSFALENTGLIKNSTYNNLYTGFDKVVNICYAQ